MPRCDAREVRHAVPAMRTRICMPPCLQRTCWLLYAVCLQTFCDMDLLVYASVWLPWPFAEVRGHWRDRRQLCVPPDATCHHQLGRPQRAHAARCVRCPAQRTAAPLLPGMCPLLLHSVTC